MIRVIFKNGIVKEYENATKIIGQKYEGVDFIKIHDDKINYAVVNSNEVAAIEFE